MIYLNSLNDYKTQMSINITIVQGIPENIQVAKYSSSEDPYIITATTINIEEVQIVIETLPDDDAQPDRFIPVGHNRKYCSLSSQYLCKILIWLFTLVFCIAFIMLLGFLVCVFLVLVFNVNWNIMEYSVEKQLGIYFGIGLIITIGGCIVNKNNIHR